MKPATKAKYTYKGRPVMPGSSDPRRQRRVTYVDAKGRVEFMPGFEVLR